MASSPEAPRSGASSVGGWLWLTNVCCNCCVCWDLIGGYDGLDACAEKLGSGIGPAAELLSFIPCLRPDLACTRCGPDIDAAVACW